MSRSADFDKLKAFIPSWLDDLDLSLLAFRLFCTISRRGEFWESKTKLESRFQVGNRSLSAAFDELMSHGLIVKVERKGLSDLYRVSASQHHPPVPASTPPPCQSAPPPSADRHHKGNPTKETPTKKPKKEIVTYSASAENGQSPFPSHAVLLTQISEADAPKIALEIQETDGADSDLAFAAPKRVREWGIDWWIKAEQSGWIMNGKPIQNAKLALRGYLRKAAAKNADRFQELREANQRPETYSSEDDDIPF